MPDNSDRLLEAVQELLDLVKLMAEPAIAQRDEKQRESLLQIVGNSKPKAASIQLMDGSKSQAEINKKTKIGSGNLSILVKNLRQANLIDSNSKNPNLAISIPANFFDK